jgi:hypothetical protein
MNSTRGHPGLRRTHSASCVRPVRAGLARSEVAASAAVLPEGVAFDGNRFNRTAATAPFFKYLVPSESADEELVSRTGIEPAGVADAGGALARDDNPLTEGARSLLLTSAAGRPLGHGHLR